jgi:thioredoxin reductase (NADPH)
VTGIEPEREVGDPVAFPELSDAQLVRLSSYGTPQMVDAGDVLYGPGDPTCDLIVIEDATVEIVQPATRDAPTESLVQFGPGSFLGELNLLTGQAVYLIARVVEGAASRLHASAG